MHVKALQLPKATLKRHILYSYAAIILIMKKERVIQKLSNEGPEISSNHNNRKYHSKTTSNFCLEKRIMCLGHMYAEQARCWVNSKAY